MQQVILNGQLVPEAEAVVSVHDRGFLYGDGLFETLVIWAGRPFRWPAHLERLRRGLQLLNIPMPFTPPQLLRQVTRLVEANAASRAVLRLAVSRGVGARGYSPKGAGTPTVILSLHPLPAIQPGRPPGWTLKTSAFTVPLRSELSACKTANKLLQVLARQEAEAAGADEALLLNAKGEATEAAAGNLCWISDGVLGFPPERCGALPGITQAIVIELANQGMMAVGDWEISPKELHACQGAFITLTTLGVVEITALDKKPLARSPLVKKLHAAYWECVARECETAVRRRQPRQAA